MKIIKVLISVLVSLMLVISLALIPSMGSNNYRDTKFAFSLKPMEWKKTPYRQKTDATSAYMKCTESSDHSKPYYGKVGAYYERLNGDSLEIDASNGHVYTFYYGQSGKKMINYVWEWKPSDTIRAYAGIYVSTNDIWGLVVSGLWSPDSI